MPPDNNNTAQPSAGWPWPGLMSQLLRCVAILGTLIGSQSAAAQAGIDEFINSSVQPLTDMLSSVVFFSVSVFGVQVPLVVAWLVIGAVFFTLYFNFLNVRGFAHAIRLVRGDYADKKLK